MALNTLGFCITLPLMAYLAGCTQSQTALPITIAVTPQSAAIAEGQTVHLTATITNSVSGTTAAATTNNDSTGVMWSATTGTVDAEGNYTAPAGTPSTSVSVTATSKVDRTKFASATVYIIAPGNVSSTVNPQVAQYSITPGTSAKVSVRFGLDTNYGLTTWTQPSSGTSSVSLLVAGMKPNTVYHLSAEIQFDDGTQYLDTDHVFTTGEIEPASQEPSLVITTAPGMTPQSGIELLDILNGVAARPTVTDLSGNVLWAYTGGPNGLDVDPIKLLPNGDFLMNFNLGSALDGNDSILQEVDLTGTLVWQLTAADLNKALAAATCAGCNITVIGTHHDFVMLPNGHLIVIAATQQNVSGTTVTGDVLIDLDQNRNPVWLWNEFDHLDINRRPFMYPDWTHTNAILYSPDDGNLIISIRHQNWLVKIDYANGAGAGDILWHLGYQGDFTLVGGTDPTDWFYAQHGPSFASSNTTGTFSLGVFDNGNDRVFPSGVTCGSSGAPPCLYSTAQILQLDETAKTATFTFHTTAPWFSFFGGNTAVLKNGHVEYCESAGGPAANSGEIYEVTQDSSAQPVWHMQVTGQYVYRGQRLPSFYPGVQW
jgi:arylsulfate sulfotransferase